MAAAAAPQARAGACTTTLGPGTVAGCTNAGALSGINITNATVTGNLVNTGTISPGGINLTNSTISNGKIFDTGTITGGIAIDASSKVNVNNFTNAINVQSTTTFGGGISNAGTISSFNQGISVALVSTFTGGIINSGSVSSSSSGPAIGLFQVRSFAGGIFNNGGTLSATGGGDAVNMFGSGVEAFSNGIFNSGSISTSNGNGIRISGLSAFSGGISNIGTIRSLSCGNGIRVENVAMFSGNISNGGTISSEAVDGYAGIFLAVSTFLGGITNTGLIIGSPGIDVSQTSGVSIFDSGTITSTQGTAIQFGGGVNTLTLGPGYVINGNVLGSGGDTFQLGGTGSGIFDLSTIGAQYQGFTTFNAVSGTWTVFGFFGQSNPWTVQGGTLLVDGDLSAASHITVNSGATLGGNGILPSTTILAGGTLAPGGPPLPVALAAGKSAIAGGTLISNGNVLTIQGNLMMTSAAMYLVNVSPSTASRTNVTFITDTSRPGISAAPPVTGTASIGGLLIANATGGTYTLGTKYTVLTATGGVTGTFALATTGSFGAFRPVISYDADDVYLTMNFAVLTPLLPPGATINERDVAGAIDAFVLGGGSLPAGFQNIFNFSPQQIQNALNQLTGEVGTGAQQSAFQLMTEFMDLLFAPPGGGGGGGAMGFAPERDGFPSDVALAYASVLKAPPAAVKSPVTTWGIGLAGAAAGPMAIRS